MLEQEGLYQPQIRSFEERQTHEQCPIKYDMGAFEEMVLARSSVHPENPPQGLVERWWNAGHATLAPSWPHAPSWLSAPSCVITASGLQPEDESFSPTHDDSLCFSLLTPCTLGDLSCCDLSQKFPHGQAPAHIWFSIVTPWTGG